MPNVSTYILSEDHDKYLSIHSKGRGAWTKFIHEALGGSTNYPKGETKVAGGKVIVSESSIIKTPADALAKIKETFPDAECKGHEHFRRNCGLKGCKYA